MNCNNLSEKMTMIKPRLYKGIEFIALADLPDQLQSQLKTRIPKDRFIKILVDGTTLTGCVQFTDYLRLCGEMEINDVSE